MKYGILENQCTGCDEYKQLETENAELKARAEKAEEKATGYYEGLRNSCIQYTLLKAQHERDEKALRVLATEKSEHRYVMECAISRNHFTTPLTKEELVEKYIAYAKQEAGK